MQRREDVIKKKVIALLLAVLTMLLAAGCGNDGEELSRDPESMAVAYMKAFIECDTETALNAANAAVRQIQGAHSPRGVMRYRERQLV